MPLTSPIVPYDEAWPVLYDVERLRLGAIFKKASHTCHHIGSTAVPGLSAKPEIDVLVVVDPDVDMTAIGGGMTSLGYRRGGEIFPGHHFFKRDENGRRTHKVHVCGLAHFSIAEFLVFRDQLRAHGEARDAYQALKLKLEASNTSGIREYLDGKAPFIHEVLDRAWGHDANA
ncbi:MAG: GrpB family protein [Pseudomonadota bacterium]